MAWLAALRRDTDLVVPEPVATLDGSLVVTVAEPGPGRPLLRPPALDRRAVRQPAADARPPRPDGGDDGGAPGARRRVDAARRVHPAAPGHARPTQAKRASPAGPSAAASGADPRRRRTASEPSPWSRSSCRRARAAVAARAVARGARGLRRPSPARPGSSGLIHGDLHQENTLFTGDVAAAIDFDDCGWGYHLYDIAVPLSELTERRRCAAMRGAFLEAYARRHAAARRRGGDHRRAHRLPRPAADHLDPRVARARGVPRRLGRVGARGHGLARRPGRRLG